MNNVNIEGICYIDDITFGGLSPKHEGARIKVSMDFVGGRVFRCS